MIRTKTRDAQCLVYEPVYVTVLEAVADGYEDALGLMNMRTEVAEHLRVGISIHFSNFQG